MLLLDTAIIIILLLCFLILAIGVAIGLEIKQKIIITSQAIVDENKIDIEKKINGKPLVVREDMINHEGVGIVYRPSEEELEKMNEPQQTKEAKEEIAKTLHNTKDIEEGV